MKTLTQKTILILGLAILILACSTKKNTFLSRNFHALTTKYNVLFNGEEALKKGVEELRISYNDNFWEVLPLERLDISDEMLMPGEKKNPNFERAETKAVKAIQKHSIYVDGQEHNYQIDEAYFTLGKARYFDQRFLPALEAFNYVLYKYPNSSKGPEVRIWREKTNMRLGNTTSAIQNMKGLIAKGSLKKRVAKEAEMVLAQTYINTKEYDSALVHVKKAIKSVSHNEEKARLRFIQAQLYEQVEKIDSALITYQSVIKMNRKSPRSYVIYAHTNSLAYFDLEKGDRWKEEAKFLALAEDFENKKFVGVIYYQLANFYARIGEKEKALAFYNKSLKDRNEDKYLRSMNYRNLGSLYFDQGEFIVAGKYYDSTLTHLDVKSRDFRAITKKRNNLDDVIKYEKLVVQNDSILKLVAMDSLARLAYFNQHIRDLKKQEADKIEEEAKDNKKTDSPPIIDSMAPPVNSATTFYFYNPRLVQIGKNEFKIKWGDRLLKDNWRYQSSQEEQVTTIDNTVQMDSVKNIQVVDERYDVNKYVTAIPNDSKIIDSITKERNQSYYQLGMIYKEKYRRYDLAEKKFNTLLSFHPDEKYTLPVLYNLYKMHVAENNPKATGVKNKILTDYPNSRYAKLLSNESITDSSETPDSAYKKLKEMYDAGQYITLIDQLENTLIQYQGEPIIPKMELLKAYALGKVDGIVAYKNALTYVALSFPNVEEGKKAETLLRTGVLKLEKIEFDSAPVGTHKIVFQYQKTEDDVIKTDVKWLEEQIQLAQLGVIKISLDAYTRDEQLVVLHDFSSAKKAAFFIELLIKDKKQKWKRNGTIVSDHNYKVIQINKNIDAYKEHLKKNL